MHFIKLGTVRPRKDLGWEKQQKRAQAGLLLAHQEVRGKGALQTGLGAAQDTLLLPAARLVASPLGTHRVKEKVNGLCGEGAWVHPEASLHPLFAGFLSLFFR